ncbi:formate-dependent nitrite reductase complex nrfG subunit [Aeromonas diversa CDC 2478-85]|uniref:Cytochrome c-type biogenesis protein n=1 Tax=Aeromonas diversa CDC 2478-85 TaxID=1268237 RepID=N9TZU1_9GAMM|nr:cytochrome c-type biogenesis protein CcmH [Aeromonas diversa]ENY71585.1 formate-dependent nitrite reductase complex nrfG subunit [Aeromonas diversa CDC 2478-85]
MRSLLLALCLIPSLLWAADEFSFADATQAERAEALARSLRCPSCQNQNLVESNSPLARDLRLEVYQRVAAGQSDEAVRDALVERYGEFVTYRPPLRLSTLLLWGLPPLLLALCGLWLATGRRPRLPSTLSEEQAILHAQWQASAPEEAAPHPLTPWLGPAILVSSLGLAALGYQTLGQFEQWRHWQANPDPLLGLEAGALKEAAGARLQERLRQQPRDKDAWAELAQWLLYQNRFDDALWAYDRLAQLEGEQSAATRAARATVLYYRAGQRMTPQAEQELNQALSQDPGEVTALMLKASDHFLNGRYREAARLWQQLLDEGRPRLDREAVTRALQMASALGGAG